MINITVTDFIKEAAHNHSIVRMNFEYDRFNLPYEVRQSMILIGTIGQLTFKQYLDQTNVPYDFEFQAGKFDDLDFKIMEHIIEIKTSGYDDSYSNLNLFYSEGQLARAIRKGYSYCVQIFINGYDRAKKILLLDRCTTSTIAGFVKFNEIPCYKQERKYFGDDYKVPINKLKPIESLLDEVKKNG